MLTPGWRLESTALIAALFSGAFQSGAWARQTHSYTGPPVPIPDGSAAGCGAAAIAEITVPQSGSYILQFCPSVGVYIPHQRQGDAVVSLQHVETGTTVTLIDRPGYPASPFGFTAANFGHPPPLGQFIASGYSSAAYETPYVALPGLSNVSGYWGSATPLTVLVGENSAGTWRLLVSDCAAGSLGTITAFTLNLQNRSFCYANCDGSTVNPFLNVNDFSCFLNYFVAGDTRANCDGSTTPPVLTVLDFTCFVNTYPAGCYLP
jgi:subtilisin-like proprotein convertase family protein